MLIRGPRVTPNATTSVIETVTLYKIRAADRVARNETVRSERDVSLDCLSSANKLANWSVKGYDEDESQAAIASDNFEHTLAIFSRAPCCTSYIHRVH